MNIAVPIIIFLFGSSIGSFLNVLTMRLPQGQKASGRSSCPHCSHVLSARDLVPLLSYLRLGGRCRSCKKPISPRYPLMELVTGLLFLLGWLALAPQSVFEYGMLIRLLFIISVFIVVFVIDFEHLLILDRVVFPASAIILALNVIIDASRGTLGMDSFTVLAVYTAVVGYGLVWALWKISKGKWIGLGDAKLLLFLGLAVGWPGILMAFFAALASGTFVSIILLSSGAKTMKSALPFGTFLVFGGLVAMLFGPDLWYRYMVLLGFA